MVLEVDVECISLSGVTVAGAVVVVLAWFVSPEEAAVLGGRFFLPGGSLVFTGEGEPFWLGCLVSVVNDSCFLLGDGCVLTLLLGDLLGESAVDSLVCLLVSPGASVVSIGFSLTKVT